MNVLMVILGAMIGAPLRYLTDRAVQLRHDTVFPLSTFAVNMSGCLILGALTGAAGAVPGPVALLLGTGLCGALTTYSTFSYETVRLAEDGAYLLALANIVGSVLLGLLATALGFGLTAAIVTAHG